MCNIEDGLNLNVGYLCQYSDKGFELLVTTEQMPKMAETTILTCVYPCTSVICYSCTYTGLNKVRFTNTK